MFTKQRGGSARIGWGFLIGVVSLGLLSMTGFAAEVQGGKKTDQQTGNPQAEGMYLQKGLRASKIIDQTVKNDEGEGLGEVDDLIMSRNAKVETIILSVGEFLGMEEELIALPFKPLKVNGAGIVYNVTQQQMKELPGFHYEKR